MRPFLSFICVVFFYSVINNKTDWQENICRWVSIDFARLKLVVKTRPAIACVRSLIFGNVPDPKHSQSFFFSILKRFDEISQHWCVRDSLFRIYKPQLTGQTNKHNNNNNKNICTLFRTVRVWKCTRMLLVAVKCNTNLNTCMRVCMCDISPRYPIHTYLYI